MAKGTRASLAVPAGYLPTSSWYHRVDEETGFDLFRGAKSQLDVGAMHGVAGLKGNDAAPAGAGKIGPQLGRGLTESLEIIMTRKDKTFETTADIPWVSSSEEVSDARMGFDGAIENGFGFSL